MFQSQLPARRLHNIQDDFVPSTRSKTIYEFAPGRRLVEIHGDDYDAVNTELVTVTDKTVLAERVGGTLKLIRPRRPREIGLSVYEAYEGVSE